MTKILIVIARLNIGGTTQYISQAVEALSLNGYKVLILTGYVQGSEVEDKLASTLPIKRIRHLGRRINIIADLRARTELKRAIREFGPDIIYSHTFKAGFLARTIRHGVPLVHTFHGHLLNEPEIKGFGKRIVVLIEKLLAPRALYLVTVGNRVALELLEAGIGRPKQYVSIPPGVKPLELADKRTVLREFGLKDETRPIVAWLARVVGVKGPLRVVDLANEIKDAVFVMAGGGNLLNEIRDLAPENLHVMGWSESKKIWAIADVGISTSENEGMPVALIEAQLAGVPIVAIDVGSVGEVIDNQVTGFVFKRFDEKYRDALILLIEDGNLRLSMGRSAKFRASNEFSPEKFSRELLRLMSRVRHNSY